jgi:2-C-methyl-D-erythritol 4-phosphate cytidylyltransferase
LYLLAKENTQAITDDSQLFERANKKVAAVPGETTNIKITFKEDIA